MDCPSVPRPVCKPKNTFPRCYLACFEPHELDDESEDSTIIGGKQDFSLEEKKDFHTDCDFVRGKLLLNQKDYSAAIQCFKKVIHFNPDHYLAHYWLGYLFYECQDLMEALRYFEMASKLNEADADSWISLGLVLQDLGYLDKSVEATMRATEIDSNNDRAFYNLGIACRKLDYFDDSVKYFKKAIDLNPSYVDAIINVGIVHQELGSYDEATLCYEKALKIDPTLSDVQKALDALKGREI
mmetsp:Transcript_9361/g.12330  ORF Transcript_9361/g.12330 Transcript_9361/m.12330 type:complete len:241 (+) Transcript_9361:289-1011(+)